MSNNLAQDHHLNWFIQSSDPSLLSQLLKYFSEEDMRALAWTSKPIRQKLQHFLKGLQNPLVLPFRARVLEPLDNPCWQSFSFKHAVDDFAVSPDGKLLCVATSHFDYSPFSDDSLRVFVYHQQDNGQFKLLKSGKVKAMGDAKVKFLEGDSEVQVKCSDPYTKGQNFYRFTFNYKTGVCSTLSPNGMRNFGFMNPPEEAPEQPNFIGHPEILRVLSEHNNGLSAITHSADRHIWALATETLSDNEDTPTLVLICHVESHEDRHDIQLISQHQLPFRARRLQIADNGEWLVAEGPGGKNALLNLMLNHSRAGIVSSSSLDISRHAHTMATENGAYGVKVTHLRDDGLAREVRDAVNQCLQQDLIHMDLAEILKLAPLQTLVNFRLAYDHRIDEPQYLARLSRELSTRGHVPVQNLLRLANALRIACVHHFQALEMPVKEYHRSCDGFRLIALSCKGNLFTAELPREIHSSDIGILDSKSFLYNITEVSEAEGEVEPSAMWAAIEAYYNALPKSEKKALIGAFIGNEPELKHDDHLPLALTCEQYNRHSFVENLGLHRKLTSRQLMPKGFVQLVKEQEDFRNVVTLGVFMKGLMKAAHKKKDFNLLNQLKDVWSRIEDAVSANPCIWSDIQTLATFKFYQQNSLMDVLEKTPYGTALVETFQVATPVVLEESRIAWTFC